MKATKIITATAVATLGLTLLAPSALAADGDAKVNKGVGEIEFKEGGSITDKGDPEEDKEIDVPGVVNPDKGPLRVDFVSTLKFGSHNFTTAEKVYNAAPATDVNDATITRGNYVQVGDFRGAGDDGQAKGWELKASLTKQFSSTGTQNVTKIKDASLTFANPVLTFADGKGSVADPRKDLLTDAASAGKYKAATNVVLKNEEGKTSNSESMLKAEKGSGFGTYYLQYGRNKDYSKQQEDTTGNSVKLTIPANTALKAEKYVGEITWTLNEL